MIDAKKTKPPFVFKPSLGVYMIFIVIIAFIIIPGLWKAVLFMTLFTFVFLFFLFFQIKVRRLLQNMPRSTIRAVAVGMAELGGKIYAQKEVIAPLSGKKCAYYEVFISSDTLFNKKSSRTGTAYHLDKSDGFFELEDASGRIKLNSFGLEFDAKSSYYESLANPKGISMQVKNYLDKNDINLDNIYRANSNRSRSDKNHQVKIVEKTLETGSQVYVVGNAQLGEKDMLELGFKKMYPYLVSYKDEKSILTQYTKSNIILSIISIFNVVVTVSLLFYAI